MSDPNDQFARFLNLLDRLEDRRFSRFHAAVGLLGVAGVVAVWHVHSSHPFFVRLLNGGSAGKIALFVIAATPAFVAALALGQLIYPTAAAAAVTTEAAPLSAYLRQEQDSRKWRLRVAAAAVGAANFLAVMLSS